MPTIALIIDDAQAQKLTARLNNLALLGDRFDDLLERVTNIGEAQTRHRIEKEQQGPEGEPWPAWSPRYAAIRGGDQSLLIGEGNLLDSITAFVEQNQAGWGAGTEYAAAHQFGREEINLPARPYLGISEDNFDEIVEAIDRWLMEQLND